MKSLAKINQSHVNLGKLYSVSSGDASSRLLYENNVNTMGVLIAVYRGTLWQLETVLVKI